MLSKPLNSTPSALKRVQKAAMTSLWSGSSDRLRERLTDRKDQFCLSAVPGTTPVSGYPAPMINPLRRLPTRLTARSSNYTMRATTFGLQLRAEKKCLELTRRLTQLVQTQPLGLLLTGTLVSTRLPRKISLPWSTIFLSYEKGTTNARRSKSWVMIRAATTR